MGENQLHFYSRLNFNLNRAAALADLAPVNAFKCCLTVDRKLSLSTNNVIYIPKFLHQYCFLFGLELCFWAALKTYRR